MSFSMNVPYNGMTIDDCAQRVRMVFRNLGWGYSECPGFIKANVPLSLISYGEEVMVRFFQEGFAIESKCVFPLQLIDWGKNKSNVEKFLNMYHNMR